MYDQSIYGWRLADVRRLLGLAETSLPGLRRVDLETNYRCPAPVLERSVRLIEHNVERFAKVIRPRPDAPGSLVLAPSAADDVDRIGAVLGSWCPALEGTPEPTFAILARTNRELIPAAIAALRLGVAFRAKELELPLDNTELDGIFSELDAVVTEVGTPAAGGPPAPLPLRIASLPRHGPAPRRQAQQALVGWSLAYDSAEDLARDIRAARDRLAELRRDDAPLTLATAHGTKGLEFDHVAVIGLDAGRFPSARSIAESVEPDRALEEERRLAYVAWTRARRSLTLLYDPGAPSQFLLEAFSPTELRVQGDERAA